MSAVVPTICAGRDGTCDRAAVVLGAHGRPLCRVCGAAHLARMRARAYDVTSAPCCGTPTVAVRAHVRGADAPVVFRRCQACDLVWDLERDD